MATFDTNTTPAIPIQSVSDVAADLAAIIVKEETNHLTLDPAPTDVPTTEGTLSWNDQDRTLNIQTEVSTVTQQVGQEQFVRCRNSTGSTISNGKVVYLSGSSGQRPTIALASRSTDAHVESTIGIATHDIDNNSDGYVTTMGLVRGVTTTGLTEGAPIYLDTTAGSFTTTRPTSGHVVRVGWVVVAGNNGTILVHTERLSTTNAFVTAAIAEDPAASLESLGEKGYPVLYGDMSKLAAKRVAQAEYKARVLYVGDSLIANRNSSLDSLMGPLGERWKGNVFASGVTQNQWTEIPDGWVWNLSASATSFTFAASGVNPIKANSVRVLYKAASGAGTFKVEHGPTTGGPWTELAASVDADNGGDAVGVVASYDLADYGPQVIRVTRLAGDTTILGAAFVDDRSEGASFFLARGGYDLDEFSQTPMSITAPIVNAFDPDVIYFEAADSVEQIETYLEEFISDLTADMATKPAVIVAARNQGTSDTTGEIQTAQAAALRTLALANGWSMVDWRSYFGSADISSALGLLNVDGVHPSDSGINYKNAVLANLFPEVWSQVQTAPRIRDIGGSMQVDFSSYGNPVLPMLTEPDDTFTLRLGVAKNGMSSGYGPALRRRAATDANAPMGFDLQALSSSNVTTTFGLVAADGTIKIGSINTGTTTTAGTDGYQFMIGTPSTTRIPLRVQRQSSGVVDIANFLIGTTEAVTFDRYGQVHALGGFAHGGDGSGPKWTSGSGTPEGVVTAPVGSLFSRTDGGASTTLYVKESGTGNTGWVAK